MRFGISESNRQKFSRLHLYTTHRSVQINKKAMIIMIQLVKFLLPLATVYMTTTAYNITALIHQYSLLLFCFFANR